MLHVRCNYKCDKKLSRYYDKLQALYSTNQLQLKHTSCVHAENLSVLNAKFCNFCTKPHEYVPSQKCAVTDQ